LLKTLLFLVVPGSERFRSILAGIYDSRVKRYVYLGLFFFGSYLLLAQLDIVHYVIAILAIGSLYDYFFTLFPKESSQIVIKSLDDRSRLWFFGGVFPIVVAVWLFGYLACLVWGI